LITILLAFFSIALFATSNIYAGQKILATSAPIASLVSMVSGNDIEISVFRNSSGCMHHFHLKPKDLELLRSQDLIIYSSDKLESFLAKVPVKEKLELVDSDSNMHFWLDILTTRKALEKISAKLGKLHNLEHILQKMDIFELELKKIISPYKERTFITLSKELDDLFKCLGIKYIYKNPSNMSETQEIINLAKRENHNLIITQHYLSHKLEKFVDQSKIINIETENWHFDSNKELPELYFKEMKKIIEKLYG
jgi:ABC-type Zn uptake system ZnuABC Zn-binding protein ZnuA